jgi:small subunit ribosomal protein S18
MARERGSSSRRNPKDATRRVKKKPCAFCRDKVDWVDYKDVGLLRKYMSDRGKIRARRVTGNCAQHQRAVALAIKTARELVLVPYTQRTVTERSGGRGRGGRGERGFRSDRSDRPGGPGGGDRGDRGDRQTTEPAAEAPDGATTDGATTDGATTDAGAGQEATADAAAEPAGAEAGA